MKRCTNTLATAGAIAFASLAVSTAAHAVEDGFTLEFPVIVFDSGGTTNYDAATDSFTIESTPLFIQFASGLPPRPVTNGSMQLAVEVDSAGNLVGGVPGDDFVLTGDIDEDGNGSIDYSGVLLTGEVKEFCATDNPSQLTGFGRVLSDAFGDKQGTDRTGGVNTLAGMTSTDEFDLRLCTTGGALAGVYRGRDIGVTVTSEMSNFEGDFTVDFSGGAKGSVAPIDPKGACCFEDGSCVFLLRADCKAQDGTFQGSGTDCDNTVCEQPMGACCFEDGSCEVRAQEDCLAGGGDYQGDGTTCADAMCPQPDGACCFEDGSCIEATEAECMTEGGIFQGPMTNCNIVTCEQPMGACCFADGSCEERTQDECNAAGGDYQGDDTTCNDANCPQPMGACCLADGNCAVTTPDACAMQGGDYQGDGTTCNNVECDQPMGACCIEDGSCVESTQAECTEMGGEYQGNGTTCMTANCPQPMGACCFDDGSCAVLTMEMCEEQGGVYQGNGTTCATIECPERDACCFEDGTCIELFQDECNAQGGNYQGDGTTCMTAECPQPKGACCFADGSCIARTEEACNELGGEYYGDGTDCVSVDCPEPNGACCFEDGSCMDLMQSDCNSMGGNYQGDFTTCDVADCPVPKGACCLTDGACIARTEEACAALGGEYFGDGTDCVTVDCPEPPGACCLADGSCVVATQADCAAMGGLYQGDNTNCSEAECVDPVGPCCFPDGSCQDGLTEEQCIAEGGDYQGDNQTCMDVECPGSACCFPDGSCVELSLAECDAEGGDYQGDGTKCEDVDCDQDGACCFPPPPPPGPFDCNGDVQSLSMIWNGTGPVRVKAWKGDVGSTLLADVSGINVGDELTVDGYGGSPNDVIWEIFDDITGNKIGESKFHLSCSDDEMDGPEDCGMPQGNGKSNDAEFLNDWLLAGIVTDEETLDCDGGNNGDPNCVELSEAECAAAGGEFQGVGTECVDGECPPKFGACCLPAPGPFDCNGDVQSLSMIWNGTGAVRVKAWKGDVGSTLLADVSDINVGDTLTVDGYGGSPNDVIWEVFDNVTGDKIGESKFHLSCSDDEMDGPEDCGMPQGNGKSNDAGFLNDWLLAGIVTDEETLICGSDDDPDCMDMFEAECDAIGGLFLGGDTSCETTTCPEPITCCIDGNKPSILGLMYTGEDCSVTDDGHDCDDFGPLPQTAYIVAAEKESGNEPDGLIYFSGTVSVGDMYDMSAPSAGEQKLSSDSYIFVFDMQGGNVLQVVKVHLSCSKPLIPGVQFGGSMLLSCIGEDDLFATGNPDVDADGIVSSGDLVNLLSNWGPCRGCPADLNHDGVVNADDLALILNGIGAGR